MIKSKSEREVKQKIEIDLTGPQGNAYYLLGCAQNFCKQLNWDYEPIKEKMTSSDYENLLEVFDYYFGEFVILWRD